MPFKGYKQSKEHRSNLLKANKGRKHRKPTAEQNARQSERMKGTNVGKDNPMFGKKRTAKWKAEESERKKGKGVGKDNPMFGKHQTKEARKKMSDGHKGLKRTEEDRRKISIGHGGDGVLKEERTRQRCACGKCDELANPGRKFILNHNPSGSLNPTWRGGKRDYPPEWTEELRKSIRARDNHECQNPNCEGKDYGQKLAVHHIDSDRRNCNPWNLIALCHGCHGKATGSSDILYWETFYINIMQEKVQQRVLVHKLERREDSK